MREAKQSPSDAGEAAQQAGEPRVQGEQRFALQTLDAGGRAYGPVLRRPPPLLDAAMPAAQGQDLRVAEDAVTQTGVGRRTGREDAVDPRCDLLTEKRVFERGGGEDPRQGDARQAVTPAHPRVEGP